MKNEKHQYMWDTAKIIVKEIYRTKCKQENY